MDRDQRSTSPHFSPSICFFSSTSTSTSPSHPILCSCQVPTCFCTSPHLFFFTPLLSSCPFLPSLFLLLTPSLVRLLMRGGGTMVPLLPMFGNPGLKQSLFTQPVAQPGPSPSLQPGQVWLSLFHECYNKLLSQPLRLIPSPLPQSPSPTLSPLSFF